MGLLTDIFESSIEFAFMAGVPGYFVLQPWAVLKLTGRWRKAALVPLIGAIPTIAWSLYALSKGSNLWPLTFIFFAPLGFLYLVALWIAHRFAARTTAV
jgi:hypothetical protein